ncbi:hypothetical protein Tco_0628178 [Tanacetum coccineum]|uniref:Uncharacterized protein n=1 Tax=Tanacetum coccineum TaxID=301880 RepID=A0ABQ4WPK6_9ASTR
MSHVGNPYAHSINPNVHRGMDPMMGKESRTLLAYPCDKLELVDSSLSKSSLCLAKAFIWYDEDVHDLRSVETEFPAIVFNDELSSEKTLSCEPTVSSLNNNEIDFRISFDESDDEDYTVIFDKNSFSYKIIYVNDLKTDSENDNEKVNMPSFPSPEPKVSCFDDLDFFKDFENEFPAIVYNDALTSKSDYLTEPTLSPQHIDEFDLKDETSLSEYDEVEQNVLYFNDLFPFNIICPNDLKSDKDNDDDKIDTIQSSGGKLVSKNGYGVLDMALPPRDQRHQYLRFEGLQYIDVDIADFGMRLAKIYRGEWIFESSTSSKGLDPPLYLETLCQ